MCTEELTNDDPPVAVSPVSSVEDGIVLSQPSAMKMYHGNQVVVRDMDIMATGYHDNTDRGSEPLVYDDTDLLQTDLDTEPLPTENE